MLTMYVDVLSYIVNIAGTCDISDIMMTLESVCTSAHCKPRLSCSLGMFASLSVLP